MRKGDTRLDAMATATESGAALASSLEYGTGLAEKMTGAPAVDVTPSRLVTALITERGVCPATAKGIGTLFPERMPQR